MDNTELRHVLLRGPLLASGLPLWELRAAAPDHYREDPQHVLDDHTYPLRTLLIDASVQEEQGGFHQPQLISLHLIAGHSSGRYGTVFSEQKGPEDVLATTRNYPDNFSPLPGKKGKKYATECREVLTVILPDVKGQALVQALPSKRRWTFDKPSDGTEMTTPAYFVTGAVSSNEESATKPIAASFQHVLAEPVLNLDEQWPGKLEEAISVPALSLVAGRIELAVANGAFPWLGALQPQVPAEAKQISRYAIALTPEGIELECQVAFPGQAQPLSGPFLLSAEDKRLLLTLQPERLQGQQRQSWLDAWKAVLPQDGQEEELHGLRLSGDAAQIPPFRYGLSAKALKKTDRNRPGLSIVDDTAGLPVEIPARYLRLNLLSPGNGQQMDGVVDCGGGYFFLGTAQTLRPQVERLFGSQALYDAFITELDGGMPLLLAWASPRPRDAGEGVVAPYLKLHSSPDSLQVDLQTSADRPYAVTLDERRLADALRRAYGLPALAPGQADAERPLLPGFVPMSDGWLQLPFANLPPLNPQLDSDLLNSTPVAAANVLDGFLRFLPADDIPQVLSAFDPRPAPGLLIRQAPWSVTLEGAARLRVVVALSAATATNPSTLLRAQAVFDQPDLSTRGMLWLSSDRPDASEAIPRLGAGPGAFIDIPLERSEGENTVVSIALEQLSLKSTPHGQRAVVQREHLALSIDFNGGSATQKPAVHYWCRHPHMPLAAQMPMTRTLGASVRPLESRDLLPFEMTPTDEKSKRICALDWSGERVFAEIRGSWRYTLPGKWPLPPDGAAPDRGIGLVAFGVPGAELAPVSKQKHSKLWQGLRAALRFDLPVLDEAFAMALLPRSAEEPGDDPTLPRAIATGVATALDWPALERFWGEQERRLQLSRVAHSYVTGYQALGIFKDVAVDSLVGGFSWVAADTGFGFDATASLPYGWMQLNKESLAGNEALKGLEETFSASGGQLTKASATSKQILQVLGYSPASFLLSGEFLVDARGVGARPLEGSDYWWRPLSGVKLPDVEAAGRLSCPHKLDVKVAGGTGTLLHFWFKDIPLNSSGNFTGIDGIDTRAWQDGHLPCSGFEWRLLLADKPGEAFARGTERFALGELFIEPLRLLELQAHFAKGTPVSALPRGLRILARLSIGAEREDVDDGGNLIELVFVASSAGHLLLDKVNPVSQPLRLSVMVRNRLVTLQATALALNGGNLSLTSPDLTFDFTGSAVTLDGAEQGAGPTFSWNSDRSQPGELSITAATLKVGQLDGSAAGLAVTYELKIAVSPKNQQVTVLKVVASDQLDSESHVATMHLLDAKVAAQVRLSCGALCLTTLDDTEFTKAPVKGFPAPGKLRFGLLASLATFASAKPWTALQSVRFAGSFSAEDAAAQRCRFVLDRVLIEGGGAPGDWQGELTLHGSLKGRSVIGWPQVSAPSDDLQIPFPGNAANGRRMLRIDGGPGHAHEVEWLFDGQRMSMETAALINAADPQRGVWSTTVMARHRLIQGPEDKRFTAIDNIALGAMAALIPEWPGDDDVDAKVRSTFAAQYVKGQPGMLWPGRGGLGSVLYGAQGEAFRQAIYARGEKCDSIVVTGGFVGLLGLPGKTTAPLLRLPVLMGLSAGYLGSGQEPLFMQREAGQAIDINVAWPDSLAALPIALTFASAASPASAAAQDLDVAIRVGARALDDKADSRGRLEGALLVEQAIATDFKAKALEETAYFFASAAALSSLLQSWGKNDPAPRVLSVVSQLHSDRQGQHPQRRAAALLTSGDWFKPVDKTAAISPFAADLGQLLVAGDTVLAQPWPGLDFAGQADGTFDAQVAMKAYALHVRPRAALLCDRQGNWRSIALPQPTLQPGKRTLVHQAFADAGRGYPLPVLEGKEMAGVEEGFSAALRDPDSGIAALSRQVGLPALAAAPDGNNAVWLAQQRAPLYLPILSRFAYEPIPWLVPAAPRSRLPVVEQFDAHLKGLGGDTWQPLLGDRAMLAAISERPGILMARHVRVEAEPVLQDGVVAAFDLAFPRLGAPGQASSALPRMERTPRPGPFAPNQGERNLWRRPCASLLLPDLNHRALVGPADSLGGTARRGGLHSFDWTVTLVAAPETSGTITSSWDGSLRLIAEIEEPLVADEPGSWADELLQLVFGPKAVKDGQPPSLKASAALEINGRTLPFSSLHVSPAQGPAASSDGVRRGYACVILDMRDASPANARPGPALAAIADLLTSTEVTPTARLILMLHPTTEVLSGQGGLGPFLLASDDKSLPGGEHNAPVMLRFELWPVLRERGALALEPTSLLFCDPAYDDGLSAPPHQVSRRDQQRLSVFAAERQQVNRQGAIALMAYTQPKGNPEPVSLGLRLLPRRGVPRPLWLAGVADANAAVLLTEQVYQLSLGRLQEAGGLPAQMAAGDLLELAAGLSGGDSLRLTLALTDEPVAEPPPGLYAALTRTVRSEGVELSLPLYAQSPLPWRVDLLDAAAGFRSGLLRRSAKFMWTLARPADETPLRGVHIVKVDRNGQTYLPDVQSIDSDFIAPQCIVELLALAADTDEKRRERIKDFWPAFEQTLTQLSYADEKALRIRQLLLYISGMESHFGLFRDQFKGPAKGLLQLRCGMLKDIVAQADVMDRGNYADLNDRIDKLNATQEAFTDSKALIAAAAELPTGAGFPTGSAFIGLARYSDVFAATVLCLQLMRDSTMVPDSHEACYEWWLANWHTPVSLSTDLRTKFLRIAVTADSDMKALKLN